MSSFSFTVTQVTQNFTATVNSPVNLTLTENPDTVNIVNQVNEITVINTIQPVTITSGGGGSGGYNQNLNTTDNVAFATVTTPEIYGVAQQPVFFPTGLKIVQSAGTSVGVIFSDSTVQLTAWRPDQLADVVIDFGSI
jgi:hypothetical protein